MTLEEIKRRWNEVLDELLRIDRILWLAFFDGRLAEFSDGKLTLDFRDSSKFAVEHDYSAMRKEERIKRKPAEQKASAFIQNIHHFRDDNLVSDAPPVEKVVIFDEAQRAWNKEQASSFMKRKRGQDNFSMSEPDFLLSVMNRHKDWCVVVCLIGGGQEINTGEAGITEWITALKENYQDWEIHFSDEIFK